MPLASTRGAETVATAPTSPTGADAATTVPTTRPAALVDAINRLGDPDVLQREAASRQLWLAGRTAEPLLKEAAASDDPETSDRARGILHKLSIGWFADTPPEIVKLLLQFRDGDQQSKLASIDRLSTSGSRAIRILMALNREEKDLQLLAAMQKAIAAHSHDAAALLLSDGDTTGGADILRASASESDAATRDYASYLLLRGGLDARVAELKAAAMQKDVELPTIRQLVYLARAAGDLQTSRAAAQQVLDKLNAADKGVANADSLSVATGTLENVMTEQQDWPQLLKRVQSRLQASDTDAGTLRDRVYALAYARLSGDAAAFDKASASLAKFDDQQPPGDRPIAEALLLNDRVDEGIDVLLKNHDYVVAKEFLPGRLQYEKALELPGMAMAQAADRPEVSLRVRAHGADMLRLVGERDAARQMMADVARENLRVRDYTAWAYLAETARHLDDASSADEFLQRGLETVTRETGADELLEKAGIREPELLAEWWFELALEQEDQKPQKLIADFIPLARGRLLGAELERIAAHTEQWAMSKRPAARDFALDLLVRTLQAAHREPLAEALLTRWADAGGGPKVLVDLGEMQAAAGRFGEAAASYGRAWDGDRSQPVPLYLQGWALTQSGNAAGGQPLMKLADLIALGGDWQRYKLFLAMRKHGCDADADRERELLLRLGDFISTSRSEVLRLSGDAASRREDYTTAAQWWEQAFLHAITSEHGFSQPWAYVEIPVLLHKTRSLALIQKGDVPGALREARMCMTDSPGAVDEMIDVTNALQSAGHIAEADTFYSQSMAAYDKLLAAYPKSAQLNNLVSWAESKTHHNLDDAVSRARHAVELEPTSTNIIDTLAEACFAHGDTPGAITAIQRCITLEPDVARHRKQLERFRAAQTRPTTTP